MSVYKFKTDARLKEELEQALHSAEVALEKNFIRRYEKRMQDAYEIESELKSRAPMKTVWGGVYK